MRQADEHRVTLCGRRPICGRCSEADQEPHFHCASPVSMATCSDRHREPMSLWQDVRFGLRMLVKDRWFTLAASTALALGIGVNAMVFTLVNAVLVCNLPFRDPTRIMAVTMRDGRDRPLSVSLPDFEDWRRTSRTFSDLTAVYFSPFNVVDEGQAPEQFDGTYVSTNVFQLIGQQPILGRNFLPEDDRLGAAPVLLLAHGLWKRRYGGDASVIGRQVKINSLVATVIGVM